VFLLTLKSLSVLRLGLRAPLPDPNNDGLSTLDEIWWMIRYNDGMLMTLHMDIFSKRGRTSHYRSLSIFCSSPSRGRSSRSASAVGGSSGRIGSNPRAYRPTSRPPQWWVVGRVSVVVVSQTLCAYRPTSRPPLLFGDGGGWGW
jgi:hypothetical protein